MSGIRGESTKLAVVKVRVTPRWLTEVGRGVKKMYTSS